MHFILSERSPPDSVVYDSQMAGASVWQALVGRLYNIKSEYILISCDRLMQPKLES